jgi:hypothetical protein
MEGAHVLRECRGELGVVLWRTVRDLSLWAATPSRKRGELFAGKEARRVERLAATPLPAAIAAQLDTVNGMLTLSAHADTGILTICCLEIATWARRNRLPQTAVAFAQAGALVSPRFAEAALHTGVCAAEAGQEMRAGTWLRRALILARQEHDGTAYAAALAELGALYERHSAYLRRAERFYRKAYKAGRRFRSRRARVKSLNGLHRIAVARGDEAGAKRFAGALLRLKPPRSGGSDSNSNVHSDVEQGS